MITATIHGRSLKLTVETEPDEEPIEPFLVRPLSAIEGRAMSQRYLYTLEGIPIEGDVNTDIIAAFGMENYKRADATLTQAEGELLAQAAYFWQSVGGIEAVRALLDVADGGQQGDLDHLGKALGVFRLRMVPLLSQIRHRLESALQMREGSTPDTDTRSGGDSSESEPASSPSSEPTPPPPSPPTTSPEPSPATSA